MVKSNNKKGTGAQIPTFTPKPTLTEVKAVGCKKGLMHNAPFRDGISNVIPGGDVLIKQTTVATSITGQESGQYIAVGKVCDLPITVAEGVETVVDRFEVLLNVLYEHGGAPVALQYPMVVIPFVVMGPDGLTLTNTWTAEHNPIDAVMYALSGDKAYTTIDWFGAVIRNSKTETYRYWNGSALVQDWGFEKVQAVEITLDLQKSCESYARLIKDTIKSGIAAPEGMLGFIVQHNPAATNGGSCTFNAHSITMTHERARK